jgi:hypothetical protein
MRRSPKVQSIKDAGHKSPSTLSTIDTTPENLKHIDDLITNGRELFGPNQTSHL